MAEVNVSIRYLQGLTALLSCLPVNGKARELLGLALDLDEGPWLDKVGPPSDPDSDEGMKQWLESLWAQGGLTAAEEVIVAWQNNSANMTAAVAEVEAVAAQLRPA